MQKPINNSKINNEIPDKYLNSIVCGNSYDILKLLPNNCIDIIITSPPYNFGMNYDKYSDSKNLNDYFEDLFLIFEQCNRVLKYGGRFIINIQPLYSEYIPTHHIISNWMINQNMLWKGEILWEKNNYNCKQCCFGSWKSPSMPYLKYTWEFLEIFCKGTLKKDGNKDYIDITADEFKQFVNAKWSIAPESRMKDFGHPAMFPELLVERCLKLFSYVNDVVLDPFNGAGTTTYVSHKFNRNYLGIDISKEYCEMAKKG